MSKISIIEVNALTKVFDDKVRAVDGISFSVKEGEVLGFLGPNGAGKKGLYLTLRCLSDTYTPVGSG